MTSRRRRLRGTKGRPIAALCVWAVLGAAVAAGAPPRPAHAACGAIALRGCRVAARGALDVRYDATDPAKRLLRWKWTKGDPTLLPGFGFPATTSDESLCVYDASGLVLAAAVPPGGVCAGRPCWQADGKKFAYGDAAATHDGVRRMLLKASAAPKASIKVDAQGADLPLAPLPLVPPVTIQLVPSEQGVCFESTFTAETVRARDGTRFKARARATPGLPAGVRPSAGCGTATPYAPGANADTLEHDGIARTFGVYVPPSYDLAGATPAAVVVVLHGGFGSGEQVFTNARMQALADDTGVLVVYPDGIAGPGGVRTWNAAGCCGYAVAAGIDDVGFVAALLDRVGERLCVDERRVFAAGMSNGAMLAYRLACDLSPRVAAIGVVAGSDVAGYCTTTRPVAVMHVHGTADLSVPWAGGLGCGPSGVAFPSVPTSVGNWVSRNGCGGAAAGYLDEGDGHCERRGTCPSGADVVLCAIDGGGHTWPGALPLASPGFPDCPFGAQSTTFDATRRLFDFFAAHPLR